MIKKELGVYLRVPGNDQQKTDLVNTLDAPPDGYLVQIPHGSVQRRGPQGRCTSLYKFMNENFYHFAEKSHILLKFDIL